MKTTQTTIGALLALCVFIGAIATTVHAQSGSSTVDWARSMPSFRSYTTTWRLRVRKLFCRNAICPRHIFLRTTLEVSAAVAHDNGITRFLDQLAVFHFGSTQPRHGRAAVERRCKPPKLPGKTPGRCHE